MTKTKVYKLNDFITNKMEARQLIEATRTLMVEYFGLDIEIIVNNTMNCRGKLNIFEIKDGIVSRFGNIEIKTSGSQTYKDLIKTIIHEFVHINFPNCHSSIKKDNLPGEDQKHYTMTEQLTKLTIINLKNSGILI